MQKNTATAKYFIGNNQQLQLYAVNFIPLFSSLYMFRAAHTPIIRSTTVPSGTSSRDNLRQPMIVPVAVDTVVLLMMGVCAARNM